MRSRRDTTSSKCTDDNNDTRDNSQDQVVTSPLVIIMSDVYVSTWIQQKYEDADDKSPLHACMQHGATIRASSDK